MNPVEEAAINALEARELGALSWGIVDGRLTQREVLEVAEATLEENGDITTAPNDLVESLLQQAVLVRVDDQHDPAYRTRFSESIRLFARLRQLFPAHLSAGTWSAAANLVFDYRLVARSRRFPRRDVRPADVVNDIVTTHGLTSTQAVALKRLINTNEAESRLARFQVLATTHILGQLESEQTSATIITAGTGSGKTRAFYTPALTDLAGALSAESWTKILAVYPRVELLKDQLAEVIGQADRLREELGALSLRPIRIGAFFGSTPHTNRVSQRWGWRQRPDGSIECPYVACWICGAPTLWRREDREKGLEILECRDCATRSVPGQLALTRAGMSHDPPDVLFTTTEMLNRNLSSLEYAHVFGTGTRSRRPPRLLLLDEAHTYSGTTGAQAAFVIRRWRHAARGSVHIAGLSATLEDAPTFMARLTGVPESLVTEIKPADEDLVERGMEYMLALRGNPMSGTALLSSSIQALMLLRRVLDLDGAMPSGQAFGSRVFAFTDDLDVTNRLYYNLLDAEGRTYDNRPRRGRESLASLRRPDLPDELERRRDGQVWDVAVRIGHDLRNAPVSISRTSSQDVGVDVASDIVVATASLEVGFDDLRVGGVLQHKAPRDAAAFLQRKGRAGRLQQMRPWTVVVLSDYGRDRLAYQGYDLLFDPVLRPAPLPIGNRHVMKVQAALCLMDWLATRLADESDGSLWTDLSGPVAQIYYWPSADRQAARRRQLRAAGLLRGVLEDSSTARDLERFVARALRLGEGDVSAVMWQSPRSLMTTVIPTLLRRLESEWRHEARGPRGDVFSRRVPMPEHIPPTLFSELNLPEVEITALPRQAGQDSWEESMPIAQALRELAPGRVTRRFSVREGAVRHWVPIPAAGTTDVDIDTFVSSYEELGAFALQPSAGSPAIKCLRPWSAQLAVAPANIADSQSSQLRWQSSFLASGPGHQLALPSTRWAGLLRGLAFHTHGARNELEARRFAIGADANDPSNAELIVSTRFVRHGDDGTTEPVALGYAATTDAIQIQFNVPATWPAEPELERSSRRTWFVHQVQTSDLLVRQTGVFTRNWLATLYLAAMTATAGTNDVDASAARSLIGQADVGRVLMRAMDVVFEVPTDADDGTGAHVARQRTADRLRHLLSDTSVCAHLHELGAALEGPLPDSAQPWLRETLGVTVAAAFKEAFQRLCPRLDVEALLIDLEPRQESAANEPHAIWLTEPTVGGGGVVEQLAAESLADPRKLLRLAEAAVGETDYETVDRALRAIIRAISEDAQMAVSIEAFRTSDTPGAKRTALKRLLELAGDRGIPSTRAVAVAASARLLRPGTSHATDLIFHDLINDSERLEILLGFEPDARALAFALRNRYPLEAAIGASSADRGEAWRFAQLYSLIGPRGTDARSAGLSGYNPFIALVPPERLLVEGLFADRRESIDVTVENWRETADVALSQDGEAILTAPRDRHADLRKALLNLALEPTDLGFIHAFPRVIGASVRGDQFRAEVEIMEAP